MPLKRLQHFFSQMARRVVGRKDYGFDSGRFYVQRHNSFKLFLSAWNAFEETVSDLKYTLCCEHPFGLHRVRALCTSISTQVFQCINRLETLDPGPCDDLFERFNILQNMVFSEFSFPEETCILGEQVLPLGTGGDFSDNAARREAALIDPGTARLELLREQLPEAVPQGFLLTAAGCQRYFQGNSLQSEINRRIQAAGGLEPRHLRKLSQQLADLVKETPLPEDLRAAVLAQVERLRSLYRGTDMQLLFRGRVWPPGAAEECGVVVWGPPISLDASDAAMERAILATLAHKQRAQCLVYRRARGLTDAGTGMCLTCLAVPVGCWGGIAQSCAPLRPDSRNSHVYASAGLPQELEYSAMPADRVSVSRAAPHVVTKRSPYNPASPILDDETALRAAELSRRVEKAAGCPQVLTWVRPPRGGLLMLMTRPMNSPVEDVCPPPVTDAPEASVLLRGGFEVCPGRVSGPAWIARQWEDVRNFPVGGILVVPDDAYIWGALIDRCAGMVVERGFQCSRLASLAREFGKPALFGVQGAMEILKKGQRITLCTDLFQIFGDRQDRLLPKRSPGRDYMPGSPVFLILQNASKHILPLTMDVDSVDFKAANCATYNDIVNYCHERAVASMFSVGSDRRHAPQRVKQLWDRVPKQFWLVNLGDGFARVPKGPFINVEDIASQPMLALWRGMTAYPWEGPPPVNGKGFLSVLFEATANPNLEPAAQASLFMEKNYFLVSRHYCSLHSRFGFHFVSVEARLSEHISKNYLNFQMRGGAADMERRILRVRFVADILWEFGFEPVVRKDAVSASRKELAQDEGRFLLAVVGHLAIHTRQLDMIMRDANHVAMRREEILRRCRSLYQGEVPPLPNVIGDVR